MDINEWVDLHGHPGDDDNMTMKKTVELDVEERNVVYIAHGTLTEYRDLPCEFEIETLVRQQYDERGRLVSEMEVDETVPYIEAELCRIAVEDY